MELINTRTDFPYPDVAMGTLQLGKYSFYSLQHLPTPNGQYIIEPHVIGEGRLIGLHTYALIAPALGVFHYPNPGYSGPYPMRYAVLIHPGNFPKDTIGCIIIGTERDQLQPKPNVDNSVVAFKQMMDLLGEESAGHTLAIQSI